MFISFIMEDLQKEQLVVGFVCFFMCTYLFTDSGPHTEQKHSVASGFLPLSAACHPAQKQILPQFSTLPCPFFSSLFFSLCWVCLILSHGRSQTSHKHTNKPKIGLIHCYYLHFYIFLSTFHTNFLFVCLLTHPISIFCVSHELKIQNIGPIYSTHIYIGWWEIIRLIAILIPETDILQWGDDSKTREEEEKQRRWEGKRAM